MRRPLLAAAAAALTLTLPIAARAQPSPAAPAPSPGYVESEVDGNQVVTFPGDPLPGDANSAYGFEVRPPPGVLRAGLLRPRMNFVPELLKSVEAL